MLPNIKMTLFYIVSYKLICFIIIQILFRYFDVSNAVGKICIHIMSMLKICIHIMSMLSEYISNILFQNRNILFQNLLCIDEDKFYLKIRKETC